MRNRKYVVCDRHRFEYHSEKVDPYQVRAFLIIRESDMDLIAKVVRAVGKRCNDRVEGDWIVTSFKTRLRFDGDFNLTINLFREDAK